jgi:hypothetical protein
MEIITIKIDGSENVPIIMDMLKKFNFIIELDRTIDPSNQVKKNLPVQWATEKPSINDFAGIWEDRNITLDELRTKAWKRN